MIEKPKRPKQLNIHDRQPPRTLQELILRYDLDNIKIYDYLDYLIEKIKENPGMSYTKQEIIDEITQALEMEVNYRYISNKPSINNVTLVDNKSLDSLGIVNDKNYQYIQNTASNTWTINHNLNKNPAVTVIDSAGTEVIGDIEYTDINNLTITFKGAFKGKAILN